MEIILKVVSDQAEDINKSLKELISKLEKKDFASLDELIEYVNLLQSRNRIVKFLSREMKKETKLLKELSKEAKMRILKKIELNNTEV